MESTTDQRHFQDANSTDEKLSRLRCKRHSNATTTQFFYSTDSIYRHIRWAITEKPKLEREYNIVLKRLRTLPTHVFILQLMESEIESRSSHPERGAAWHKFQQHILEREGFQNFLKRNVLLQQAMVETAIRQQIPFSIFRLPSAPNMRITGPRSALTKIPKIPMPNMDPQDIKSYQRKRPPQEVM